MQNFTIKTWGLWPHSLIARILSKRGLVFFSLLLTALALPQCSSDDNGGGGGGGGGPGPVTTYLSIFGRQVVTYDREYDRLQQHCNRESRS